MSIMIFTDIHKAFDSLEWDFIVNCLEAFNFGTNFVAWAGSFLQKYTKLCLFSHAWCATRSSFVILSFVNYHSLDSTRYRHRAKLSD